MALLSAASVCVSGCLSVCLFVCQHDNDPEPLEITKLISEGYGKSGCTEHKSRNTSDKSRTTACPYKVTYDVSIGAKKI